MKFLDQLSPQFYFGAGGLGDLLLLLSTFYDLVDEANLIFWANDEKFIKETLILFPKIKKSIIFQNWPHNYKEHFFEITHHKYFKGKGHIPDNLDYRNEWLYNYEKCRKNIKIPFEYLKTFQFKFQKQKNTYIGLSFWGSSVDAWKKKHLELSEFNFVIEKLLQQHPESTHFILFGSKKDKEKNPLHIIHDDRILDVRGFPLFEVFEWLNFCDYFIGTDTWFKTFTGLINIPTTVITNRYTENLTSKFGVNIDPGDNIFIRFWNFDVYTYNEFLQQKLKT